LAKAHVLHVQSADITAEYIKRHIWKDDAVRKMLLIASVAALAAGPALAQTSPSTTDKPAASGQGGQTEKMSPGTTGAMQNSTGGVATSPQDVQKQGTGATAPTTQGDSGKATTQTGGADKKM